MQPSIACRGRNVDTVRGARRLSTIFSTVPARNIRAVNAGRSLRKFCLRLSSTYSEMEIFVSAVSQMSTKVVRAVNHRLEGRLSWRQRFFFSLTNIADVMNVKRSVKYRSDGNSCVRQSLELCSRFFFYLEYLISFASSFFEGIPYRGGHKELVAKECSCRSEICHILHLLTRGQVR